MKKNDEHPLYVTADEAARWLGVSRATLYAYVSRGQIRSEPVPGSKAKLYHRGDLEVLASRGRGAGPKASASALRFGEPLLESRISLIQDGRLYYRGYDVTELARSHRFEEVAGLLWMGELGGAAGAAGEALELDEGLIRTLVRASEDGFPIERALAGLPAVGIQDGGRFGVMREQVARSANRIVRAVVALMAPEERVASTLSAPTTAEAFWVALSSQMARPNRAELDAINGALILCADHELNASTFAARVAASTGASLYAVVSAALAALSGPRHGGASDRVEAMLREIDHESKTPADVPSIVAARLARGEGIVGYGHPLYPAGDPRYPVLRDFCGAIMPAASLRTALERLEVANATARRLGFGEPSLDIGLVSLRIALGLPVGAAAALFAVGRTAGWIAHALEQSATTDLLRPRARYVGPPPRS